MKKLIYCGKLFDSNDGTVKENMAVLVEGDKIIEVSPMSAWEGKETEGMEVVDLKGKFVSPGLIDAHVHASMNGEPDYVADVTLKHVASFAYRAYANLYADLMGGFTTVRCVGETDYIDVALRDEIAAGRVDGPRIVASGKALTSMGGHADSHYAPHVSLTSGMGLVVDGPDEARKAARTVIKHGAQCIKFMCTGGVMSAGTTVGAQQMTYDEMRAICEVAEMYGVITATHAHGTNGMKDAIRAGVTTVEHGTLMDDEAVDLMVKHGTYLVPTLIAPYMIAENGIAAGIPEHAVKKTHQVMEQHVWSFKQCLDRGVKICFGTDAATPFNFHGKQGFEFELLTKNGMKPVDALISATSTNAKMMNMWDKIGSVDAGKFADIVAYDENPLDDAKVYMNPAFVMKGGKVYKG